MDTQQQSLTWNAFQKINKGRWNRQEMSAHWAAYKQKRGRSNRQQQAGIQNTLKAWIIGNNAADCSKQHFQGYESSLAASRPGHIHGC